MGIDFGLITMAVGAVTTAIARVRAELNQRPGGNHGLRQQERPAGPAKEERPARVPVAPVSIYPERAGALRKSPRSPPA